MSAKHPSNGPTLTKGKPIRRSSAPDPARQAAQLAVDQLGAAKSRRLHKLMHTDLDGALRDIGLYVRQSSAHQVLHNRESSALQYAMRDRLIALGWSEIEVIDDDLGRSAAGGVQRAGFERMVAQVCLGKVGAVAAREVSRFARNSRDWQQLIEMCRVVDTVLIDQETIYAPRVLQETGGAPGVLALVKCYARDGKAFEGSMHQALRHTAVEEYPMPGSNAYNLHPVSVATLRKELFAMMHDADSPCRYNRRGVPFEYRLFARLHGRGGIRAAPSGHHVEKTMAVRGREP
jgi:hypothetical protein